MICPKQAIICCASARPQKQWHLNAKCLLKESNNACGLAQATGRNGMPQPQPGLIGEYGKKLVEAVLLQGLRQADATRLFKTEIKALFADA